jgi:hypothetical protein
VQVSSGAGGSPVVYYDTSSTYTLSVNEGRLVAGDFDGDGFADDIAMGKNNGDGRIKLYRLLFDGPNQVTNTSAGPWSIDPALVGDRMVAGDFTNDGIDDVAFVIQKSPGPGYQVQVSSGAGGSPVVYYDTSSTYTLSVNEGRLVAGDFDGD